MSSLNHVTVCDGLSSDHRRSVSATTNAAQATTRPIRVTCRSVPTCLVVADHMTRGTGNKLVNLIARKLEARSGYQKQTTSLPSGNATPPTNTMRMPHVTTSLRA